MSHKNPGLARSLDHLRRGRVAPRPETEVLGHADTRTDFTTPDCSELGKISANRWRLRLVYGLDAIEELAEIALCALNSGSAASAVCRSFPVEVDFGHYPDDDPVGRNLELSGATMRGCLAMFVVAACLAGCASGPTGGESLTSGFRSSAARLVIYRASAVGFAIQPDYVVDGRVIAGSQPAGFVVCDLPPGRHEVAVANLPISNNLFGHGSEKISIDLRAGSAAYLSAEPQPGIVAGQITLIQVTENQGRADTASLHQTNSTCGKA
jgi:hypothetical protein